MFFISLFYNGTTQTKSSTTYFNEFSISLNSPIRDNNISNQSQLGFDLSAKHKKFQKHNFIIGIEYSFYKYFLKNLPFAGKTNISDINFQNHSLTIPVSYRFNFGKKIKIFIESGVFFEYVIFSKSNYTVTSTPPFSNITIKQESNNGDTGQVKYGLIFGLGLKMPYKYHMIFIKPELKIGKQTYGRLVLGIDI